MSHKPVHVEGQISKGLVLKAAGRKDQRQVLIKPLESTCGWASQNMLEVGGQEQEVKNLKATSFMSQFSSGLDC